MDFSGESVAVDANENGNAIAKADDKEQIL